MTVQELIDQLAAVPDKALPVESEGCDCDGDISEVRVQKRRVYLARGQH